MNFDNSWEHKSCEMDGGIDTFSKGWLWMGVEGLEEGGLGLD